MAKIKAFENTEVCTFCLCNLLTAFSSTVNNSPEGSVVGDHVYGPEASLQQRQNVPAQAQVRAWHATLRAAQEGAGVSKRGPGPEAGRAAAARRGPQRLGGRPRGRLLQPHQPHLRHNQRLLHRPDLPRHVRRAQVRIPLAGRAQVQEADRAVRAQVHESAHGLDRGTDQQREHLPHQRW